MSDDFIIFDELCGEDDFDDIEPKHPFVPVKILRMLICGPSGCGKSNILMNILLRHQHLECVHICSPTIETKYEYLQNYMQDIEARIHKDMVKEHRRQYNNANMQQLMNTVPRPCLFYRYYKPSQMPPCDELNDMVAATFGPQYKDQIQMRHTVIFDDIMAMPKREKELIDDYAIRCRKYRCNMFVLIQNYFEISPTVRQQCNYLCLFKIPDMRKVHNFYNIFGADIPKEEFLDLYKRCTEKKYGFLSVNMQDEPDKGKYSRALRDLYIPSAYVSKR